MNFNHLPSLARSLQTPGDKSPFSFKTTAGPWRLGDDSQGWGMYIRIPSSNLTWHWKITIFNRKYIYKGSIFQPAMLVYQRELLRTGNLVFETANESCAPQIVKPTRFLPDWLFECWWKFNLHFILAIAIDLPKGKGSSPNYHFWGSMFYGL